MNLSHPIESVIPSAHGPVLAVLASTDAALTGRGVATLVEGRVSTRRVADVLSELVQAGLVTRTPVGVAYQYLLNREHLAASAITALAQLRSALLESIAVHVGGWSPAPIAVWLFGSTARGDAGEDSDVDLLVIRAREVTDDDEAWVNQVGDLERRISAWTGNGATVVEYDEGEFTDLVDADDNLVTTLRAEAMHIAGETITHRTRVER